MANQTTSDKKDKTGGDVTKAEVVLEFNGDKTSFDILNNTGANSVGSDD